MKKWIYVLVALLVIGAGGYSYKLYMDRAEYKENMNRVIGSNMVYHGISVSGIDLSDKTYDVARSLVEEDVANKLNKIVDVKVEDEIFSKTFSELGLSVDYTKALDEAINYAKSGEDKERYEAILALEETPVEFNYTTSLDESAINSFVEEIASGISSDAIDASIEFNNGSFKIIKGQNGRELNKEKLFNDIKDVLFKDENVEITAELNVIDQAVKNEALERINGVIGTFTSNLGNGTVGRNQNVILSAKKISNRVILPGQSISFNHEMGDITLANGYKMASTIVNGEYVDSLGGGLCQTSTTLYNALVRSDVKIDERHPHSIAAPYVPVGEDGAVWVGSKDLKFTNNWDFPIVILSNVDLKKNTISFTIYGDTQEKDYDVEMYSKIYEKIQPQVIEKPSDELFEGETKVVEPGRTGMRVQSYKVYKKDGKVIKEIPYMKSYYPKRDKVILIGSKPKESIDSSDTIDTNNPTESVDLFD